MTRAGATLLSPALLAPAVCAEPFSAADIQAALERLDAADQDERWFFTMHVQENDQRRVIHHDPTRPPYEQRTLASIDDQPASAEQRQAFRKQEKKRVDERDPQAGYGKLVDLASLQWQGTQDSAANYSFIPNIQSLEEARDTLRGALVLDTQSGEVTRIEVFNSEAFSPAISVTMDEYRLSFEFHDEQGTRLLQRMESRAVGTAGFVQDFDKRVVVDFSAYRPAAEQAAAAGQGATN